MKGRKDGSIGIFDSGIGGLTVVRGIMERMPFEPVVYFGDTARLPYGSKSRETVIRYSLENSFFLMDKTIKALVVACNTASAYSIDKLRGLFTIPVIDVIQPSVERACQLTKNSRIAVLGTRATISSGVYQEQILKRSPKAKVFPVACPLFVPLVEEGLMTHALTDLAVKEYLLPLRESGVDTVILGCTHYPLLKDQIERVLGSEVLIVDSATACAQTVERELDSANLRNGKRGKVDHRYFVSDDPVKFRESGEAYLGRSLGRVTISMGFVAQFTTETSEITERI